MKPISVGIAGLGRSGWSIHANALSDLTDTYKVVAAMDFSAERRDEAAAKFGCKTYETYAELINDPEVELVVVATPNRFHTSNAIEALRAGKHVLCEKPFGTNSSEAGEMIAVAKEVGKIVAPFQNRRYEPLFQKVREIVESGILGELQLIRQSWAGFSRRWDWQTLTEFEGGQILNNGPHAIDQSLQLFGDYQYQLLADLRNVLTSGDAEDFIKIVLKPEPDANGRRGPILEIEMTSSYKFPIDRWVIQGDSGSLRATGNKVEWAWVDWSKAEPRPVEREPSADRSYNRDDLTWEKAEWEIPSGLEALEKQFYNDLYATLREDKPLTVSPESVQRVMRLIEEVKAASPVQQGRFSCKQ
jgi:predicted dehydrogenase